MGANERNQKTCKRNSHGVVSADDSIHERIWSSWTMNIRQTVSSCDSWCPAPRTHDVKPIKDRKQIPLHCLHLHLTVDQDTDLRNKKKYSDNGLELVYMKMDIKKRVSYLPSLPLTAHSKIAWPMEWPVLWWTRPEPCWKMKAGLGEIAWKHLTRLQYCIIAQNKVQSRTKQLTSPCLEGHHAIPTCKYSKGHLIWILKINQDVQSFLTMISLMYTSAP